MGLAMLQLHGCNNRPTIQRPKVAKQGPQIGNLRFHVGNQRPQTTISKAPDHYPKIQTDYQKAIQLSKWLFIGHTRPQVVIQRPWAPALGPSPRWPFGIPRWLYRNLKRLNCCSKWLSRGPSGHLKGPSDHPETSSGLGLYGLYAATQRLY